MTAEARGTVVSTVPSRDGPHDGLSAGATDVPVPAPAARLRRWPDGVTSQSDGGRPADLTGEELADRLVGDPQQHTDVPMGKPLLMKTACGLA